VETEADRRSRERSHVASPLPGHHTLNIVADDFVSVVDGVGIFYRAVGVEYLDLHIARRGCREIDDEPPPVEHERLREHGSAGVRGIDRHETVGTECEPEHVCRRLSVMRLLVEGHLRGAGRHDSEGGHSGARGPVAEIGAGPDETFHERAVVTVPAAA